MVYQRRRISHAGAHRSKVAQAAAISVRPVSVRVQLRRRATSARAGRSAPPPTSPSLHGARNHPALARDSHEPFIHRSCMSSLRRKLLGALLFGHYAIIITCRTYILRISLITSCFKYGGCLLHTFLNAVLLRRLPDVPDRLLVTLTGASASLIARLATPCRSRCHKRTAYSSTVHGNLAAILTTFSYISPKLRCLRFNVDYFFAGGR